MKKAIIIGLILLIILLTGCYGYVKTKIVEFCESCFEWEDCYEVNTLTEKNRVTCINNEGAENET